MVMSLQDEINFFTYKQVKEIISYITRRYTHANADFMHADNHPLYPCRSCTINSVCHPVIVICPSRVRICSSICESKIWGDHYKSCHRGSRRIIKIVFFPICSYCTQPVWKTLSKIIYQSILKFSSILMVTGNQFKWKAAAHTTLHI